MSAPGRTYLPHRRAGRFALDTKRGRLTGRLMQIVGGRRWSLFLLTDLRPDVPIPPVAQEKP